MACCRRDPFSLLSNASRSLPISKPAEDFYKRTSDKSESNPGINAIRTQFAFEESQPTANLPASLPLYIPRRLIGTQGTIIRNQALKSRYLIRRTEP